MCVVEFVIKHFIKFAIKGCCNVSESSPSSQNNVHHDLVYSFEGALFFSGFKNQRNQVCIDIHVP